MHTDAQRHQLYDELSDLLSDSSRDVLMGLLPPNGWADVARQSDIALLRDDMTALTLGWTRKLSKLWTFSFTGGFRYAFELSVLHTVPYVGSVPGDPGG